MQIVGAGAYKKDNYQVFATKIQYIAHAFKYLIQQNSGLSAFIKNFVTFQFKIDVSYAVGGKSAIFDGFGYILRWY